MDCFRVDLVPTYRILLNGSAKPISTGFGPLQNADLWLGEEFAYSDSTAFALCPGSFLPGESCLRRSRSNRLPHPTVLFGLAHSRASRAELLL